MSLHPLTNFEIQTYSQHEYVMYQYVINLDGHVNNGTSWVANYVKNNVATCFDSFGVEHNLNEIKYL